MSARFHKRYGIKGRSENKRALSVIASKAKQSRLGLRICGLVWIASLSLAMTASSIPLFPDDSESSHSGTLSV